MRAARSTLNLPTLPIVVPPTNAKFTSTNTPWTVATGESLTDNAPAGVPIVNVSTYSTSDDFYVAMTAVDNNAPGPVYVRLEAKTYYINSFHAYGTNDWRGFANTKRKVMGWVGAGADKTFIQVAANAINATPDARDFALNATASTRVPITALYMTNSSSTTPLFMSGVTYRAELQTPYGVYSSASQAYFSMNQSTTSPIAWNGFSIWGALAGSRFQYSRFQGFGFALAATPPFECGCVNSNRNVDLFAYRCEMDGRVAPELDATQPRASGGWMMNKELKITIKDSWEHHTRRSGWATNTNTLDESEEYIAINFQCENIAEVADSWAGSSLNFNASNVEGVLGTFTYNNCYLSVPASNHIAWAVPYSGSNGTYTAPNHTVIKVNGFRTDDTAYNGCLRIRVAKTPNSTGTSPVWQKIHDVGIAASGFFDIRDANGNALTGVKSTSWNSSMNPDQYYVVIYESS